MNELLLYSLAEFRNIILPALDLMGARSVVEIGGEAGKFTEELVSWAEERDAIVRCIDPKPSDALVELANRSSALEVLRCRSLEALDDLEPADVYLVDGDHNYYTLSRELRAIFPADGDQVPVVFLHDVGWPAGRRDMYYDPEGLPPEAVHPYDYENGVTVGCPSTVPNGFRGAGEFAWARSEGGPANGVRTALEDFLGEHPELDWRMVPCIFGLAVVFPSDSAAGEALAKLLEPYHGNPILERMERNRLELYLHVLDLQSVTERFERAVEDWSLRARDAAVENRALWTRVEELEGHLADLAPRHAALARELRLAVGARSFAVAEQLSKVRARLRRGSGMSGARLLELLDAASPGAPSPFPLVRPAASDPTAPRATR